MKISKAKFKGQETYNDYDVELSFSQLTAIRDALSVFAERDAVGDEMLAEINYYLDKVPGPGESEEDLEKAAEAEASGLAAPEAAGQPLAKNPADDLLPDPETAGAAAEAEVPAPAEAAEASDESEFLGRGGLAPDLDELLPDPDERPARPPARESRRWSTPRSLYLAQR